MGTTSKQSARRGSNEANLWVEDRVHIVRLSSLGALATIILSSVIMSALSVLVACIFVLHDRVAEFENMHASPAQLEFLVESQVRFALGLGAVLGAIAAVVLILPALLRRSGAQRPTAWSLVTVYFLSALTAELVMTGTRHPLVQLVTLAVLWSIAPLMLLVAPWRLRTRAAD